MALADSKAFERSLHMLQAYDREHPDALIIPGHDMAHWETLAERYEAEGGGPCTTHTSRRSLTGDGPAAYLHDFARAFGGG